MNVQVEAIQEFGSVPTSIISFFVGFSLSESESKLKS